MRRTNNRRISQQSITTYEVSYATTKEPTNAAFISKETIQTDAEKEDIRQTSQNVYAQSGLAKDKKAEGQAQTSCAYETLESETFGYTA